MSKIVIVGHSGATVRAIEEIRKSDSQSEVTLISCDGRLPYDRFKLADILAGNIKENQAFYQTDDFYKKFKVEVVCDQPISRISFKRSHVTGANKKQWEFDTLIIADTPETKLPVIKGNNKEGVFGCTRLGQIKEILKYLSLVKTVTVEVTNVLGIRIACAITRHKKEVVIVVPTKNILSELLDEESSAMCQQLFEQSGIQVISKNSVQEILGDLEVKAVRLTSGKVLASDMVIFDGGSPDFKFFAESGLELEERIKINDHLRTNLSHVFAVDAVVALNGLVATGAYDNTNEELEEQGRVVGANASGQDAVYRAPLKTAGFVMEKLSGFWIGKTQLEQGEREFLKFDPQRNIYKKIFARDDCMIGAVAFNANKEREKFYKLITEQTNITGVEEYVVEDHFGLEQIRKLQDEQRAP